MSDHDDHGHGDHDAHGVDADEHGHDIAGGLERTTSPMQEFTTREVGIGFAVLAVGLLVAFALPLLAA